MKHSKKLWMLAAILFCGAFLMSCGNKKAKEQPKEVQEEVVQIEKVVSDAELCNAAVDDYLVNVIGKNYAEAEYCIPCPIFVSTDDGNKDDVLVWGDFWVFNYDVAGDTLKTVSGGSHPGLMHVKWLASMRWRMVLATWKVPRRYLVNTLILSGKSTAIRRNVRTSDCTSSQTT